LDYLSEAEESQSHEYLVQLQNSESFSLPEGAATDSTNGIVPGAEFVAESDKSCGSRDNCCLIVDPTTSNIVTKASYETPDTFLSLGHCIMKAIENVALLEQSQRKRVLDGPTANQKKQYYCTGFDLYTRYEPCMMCAMALVHSRIRRVFFLHPATPSSTYRDQQVHTHPLLNHHYQVFQVVTDDGT
jgi:tRNA-specific adenosine deaminase 3